MNSTQCIGIDISKDTFTACLCLRDSSGDLDFTKVESFANEKTGFNQLMRWAKKYVKTEYSLSFLMEATGVYHENLAHHLHKIKKEVHVVLPNKSHHYFRSLNVKSKTDELDARVLARFGVERNHPSWRPADPVLGELRNLTRYLDQLKRHKTSLSNQQHSKEYSAEMQQHILKSNKKLITATQKEIDATQKQIEKLIKSTPWLKEKIDKLTTIKGVGIQTVATVVAETKGFQDITNAKQLTSFAGLDVVYHLSGTSINRQTRISKKGNPYIRSALYFPGMAASRHNLELKAFYTRIIQRKPAKMIGQVAVQRKLLLLMYALWKKDEVYIPNYKNKTARTKEERAARDRSVADLHC